MAAVDYFLKITGIDGETTDDKRKGEMDVESWSWGATNAGTSGFGGGAGAGKSVPGDFHFVKKYDKASPNLFLNCAMGKHHPEAILTARKAGGGQQEYLKVYMSDVFISSYQTGGSGSSDVVPMDQVSLNFTKIKFEYKIQNKDGSVAAGPVQTYDFSKHVKV